MGLQVESAHAFAFDDKTFLALFASIAVDLGIVFATIIRNAPLTTRRRERAGQGQGEPAPPASLRDTRAVRRR
jgi:hypothetical protein